MINNKRWNRKLSGRYSNDHGCQKIRTTTFFHVSPRIAAIEDVPFLMGNLVLHENESFVARGTFYGGSEGTLLNSFTSLVSMVYFVYLVPVK